MRPSVTAIVVNHNRGEMLRRTVDSLLGQTVVPGEILIIDNGSGDDSTARVRGLPGVRVIELGENTGASGGFCHGIAHAMATAASHFLVLDSDVTLAPECAARLQAALVAAPEVGVVGPKVYHWDSVHVLQEFGGWIDWETADLRRSHWQHDEATSGLVTCDQSVDYVPACCLLVSRAAVERAGNFDPAWFLYWDDIDWCARIRAAGLGVRVTATTAVQHYGGGANKRSLIPVYYGWRNRLAFFSRTAPSAKRGQVMSALLEDYLLARFTCRSLGLPRTAAMMERAVEDALQDVRGERAFAATEIELDLNQVVATPDAAKLTRVFHVIGSATAELAGDAERVLEDRFGKRLPASRGFELLCEFERTTANELSELLARISPSEG